MTVAWYLVTRVGTIGHRDRGWFRLAARATLCGGLICSMVILMALAFGLRRSPYTLLAERIFYFTNSAGTIFGFLWLRRTALRMRKHVLAALSIVCIVVSLEMCYAYLRWGMGLPLPYLSWMYANQYIDLAMIGPVFSLQREYNLGSAPFAFSVFVIGAAAIMWMGFGISFFAAGKESARRRKARRDITP